MQREIGSTFTYNGKEYKVCNSINWCDGCDFFGTDCSNIEFLGNCTNRIFKEMKKFTKSDLKPGMVVEYKDGNRRLVTCCKKGIFFMGDLYKTVDSINELTEDLKCSYTNHSIDKVYIIKWEVTLDGLFNTNNLELIWERKEPKEYTMQEIADKLGIPVEELRIKR